MKHDNLFEHQAFVKFNTKVRYYPDGKHKIVIATKDIFVAEGYERAWDKESVPKPQSSNNEVRDDSLRRATQVVSDISRLNEFTHFITWTLDSKLINRYDSKEVSKKLKKFLNNMVCRQNLKYLVIPEQHKDGAIHMHGLISGDVSFVDSGTVIVKERKKPVSKETALKNGWAVKQTIYNMPSWTLGYSTAIELDGNIGAISTYITKYISKDFRKIFGNFYYAGGHGLSRKPPTQLYDIQYLDVNSKEYTKFGIGYKYLESGDKRENAEENTLNILKTLGCI